MAHGWAGRPCNIKKGRATFDGCGWRTLCKKWVGLPLLHQISFSFLHIFHEMRVIMVAIVHPPESSDAHLVSKKSGQSVCYIDDVSLIIFVVLERTRTFSGSVLVLSKFRQFEVRFWERSSSFRRRFDVGSVRWFRLGSPLIICQGKNVSESIFGTKSWCKKTSGHQTPAHFCSLNSL